jgi:radical SAM-linked protein
MSELRQRWRLTVCRGPDACHVPHRDVVASWETAMRASDLPLAETAAPRPRPRILFAAPVPVGMLAERELIDVGLTECRPVHEVREAVASAAPTGYRLIDLYDVWTGAPPLPSLVMAADYRASVTVRPGAEVDSTGEAPTRAAALEAAIEDLLAARRIEIGREKGGGATTIDIRPHLLRLRGTIGQDGSVQLDMRMLLGGSAGVGRPEEVAAALAGRLGRELAVTEVVRERIHLADDPPRD